MNFLFSSGINGNSKIMYNRDPRTRVEQGRSVPDHRHQAVPGGRRRPDRLDRRRLHHGGELPVCPGGRARRRHHQLVVGRAAATQVEPADLLHPQLGEGDRRRLRRHRHPLPGGRHRPGAQGLGGRVPRPDPAVAARSPTICGPISGIPEDLFEVQRNLLVKYNVDNPVDFFNNAGFWKIPGDPTSDPSLPQPPYYLQVRTARPWSRREFQLTSVLTGYAREFMAAYISAVLRSGELRQDHRAPTTVHHPDAGSGAGADLVPDHPGGQRAGHPVAAAGRQQGDLRQPADPAGQRGPALRRAVLHPGRPVDGIPVPAAELGAGLVRQQGRGRAHSRGGAAQSRAGGDTGRHRRRRNRHADDAGDREPGCARWDDHACTRNHRPAAGRRGGRGRRDGDGDAGDGCCPRVRRSGPDRRGDRRAAEGGAGLLRDRLGDSPTTGASNGSSSGSTSGSTTSGSTPATSAAGG